LQALTPFVYPDFTQESVRDECRASFAGMSGSDSIRTTCCARLPAVENPQCFRAVGEGHRFEPQKRWGAAGLQQPPGRSHQKIMKMDPSGSAIGPQDRATPASELNDAVLTHHMLALSTHSGSRG